MSETKLLFYLGLVVIPGPIYKAYESGALIFGANFISIKTLEGRMRADLTDWIY